MQGTGGGGVGGGGFLLPFIELKCLFLDVEDMGLESPSGPLLKHFGNDKKNSSVSLLLLIPKLFSVLQ